MGGATAAALESEAAVDASRKEVADCVVSFPARLGSRVSGNYAARASPLRYEHILFFCSWPNSFFSFFHSFFGSLFL